MNPSYFIMFIFLILFHIFFLYSYTKDQLYTYEPFKAKSCRVNFQKWLPLVAYSIHNKPVHWIVRQIIAISSRCRDRIKSFSD